MKHNYNLKLIVQSCLSSYAQVFFAKSNAYAVLILVATFIDPIAGICGLACIIISNLLAKILGFDHHLIREGLYGVNSLLVGLGIGLSFQFNFALIVLVFFASIFSFIITVWITGRFAHHGLPGLSVPFLIVSWIIILAARQYDSLWISERGIYVSNTLWSIGGENLVKAYDTFRLLSLPIYVEVYLKSLGAILFQYNLLAGVLLAIGLLFYSRIGFMLSVLGFASGWFYYYVVGGDFTELSYSYIGFNFILTAISLGGIFLIPSTSSILLILLITPINAMLIAASVKVLTIFQLPALALPFNIIVLVVIYFLKSRPTPKFLKLTFTQYFSAEKNLYYQHNWLNRFGKSASIQAFLPFYGEWFVPQAHKGDITHKGFWQYAWDFVMVDEDQKTYQEPGKELKDFYCYNFPVLAPGDGVVTEIVSDIEDNEINEVNLVQNWGNTVIIKHLDGLYSKHSHLKTNSITAVLGAYVRKGDILGYCGNSGRSPEPHLHFQFQATPYIGSHTIQFPFAYYLEHDKDKVTLRMNDYPVKDSIVSNVNPDKIMRNAFEFTLGRTLNIEVETNGKKEYLQLEVCADIYNKTYFYCKNTDSMAWFVHDGTLFYFVDFKGDMKSQLYYIYLGLNKVLLANYSGLSIKDAYPLYLYNNNFMFWIEDIIAPFYMIKKSEYELNYVGQDDQISNNEILLRSKAVVSAFGKVGSQLDFETQINSSGIERIVISQSGKQLTKLLFLIEEGK